MVLGKQFHQLCNCLQAISGAIELGQYGLAKRETERAIALVLAARKVADGISLNAVDWSPAGEQNTLAENKS